MDPGSKEGQSQQPKHVAIKYDSKLNGEQVPISELPGWAQEALQRGPLGPDEPDEDLPESKNKLPL